MSSAAAVRWWCVVRGVGARGTVAPPCCCFHSYPPRHNLLNNNNQLGIFYKDTNREQNRISPEEVITFLDSVKPKVQLSRHELRSKLEMLEVVGCSLDQIQECPEILQFSQAEIMNRATRLQEHGYHKFNVQMLKLVHSKGGNPHIERTKPLLNLLQNYSTITEFMMDVLDCSELEFREITVKIPMLKKLRNMPAFAEKVKYLQSFNIKTEDLIKYPSLLNYSTSSLKKRIQKMKVYEHERDVFISHLALPGKKFNRFVNKHYMEQRILEGSSDRYDFIAKMFNIPVSVAKELSYLENRRLTTLKPRVDFLKSIGIPVENLRSHTYILRHKTETLKKAYAKAQEAGIEKISLLHIIHIIACKNVPLKVPSPKSTVFIPKLIGIETKTLQKKLYHISSLVSTDRITLTTNFEYLTSRGITKEDICSCPLVLSHSPPHLRHVVESLKDRSELEECLHLLSNGAVFVNLVQYIIEKEMNFRNTYREVV
ncbi:uncharacterized protein LOC115222379 [Argonauta hians]